jgi:hypothetical protein
MQFPGFSIPASEFSRACTGADPKRESGFHVFAKRFAPEDR